MSEFRVRRARLADAGPIARIHIAAWRRAYRGIMDDAVLDGLDHDRQSATWARNLGDEESSISTFVLIRSVDGECLGFGGVCPPRDAAEVLDRLPDASGLGQLAFINVHPDHFGTGAASVLFDALEDELRAQGWRRAYLMVAEGNHRAMRFYAKKGWQRTEITHVFAGVTPAVPERMYVTDLHRQVRLPGCARNASR